MSNYNYNTDTHNINNSILQNNPKVAVQDDDESYADREMCGIAYFLMCYFTFFEPATRKLEEGIVNLTTSTEHLIELINDNKNKKLEQDNAIIQETIRKLQGDKDTTKVNGILTGELILVEL